MVYVMDRERRIRVDEQYRAVLLPTGPRRRSGAALDAVMGISFPSSSQRHGPERRQSPTSVPLIRVCGRLLIPDQLSCTLQVPQSARR